MKKRFGGRKLEWSPPESSQIASSRPAWQLTALLFATIPLVGCASTRAVEGPVGLGHTAYVSGPRVHPQRIVEDSRCPMNARCVHAGRLVVHVTVWGGSWTKEMDLTLGVGLPVADGTLTLVAVTPERIAGQQPAKASPYRFTFNFEGGI